ncbi:MAG: glycosyltransferase family 2 protein [Alphaproteobacteria bacterium]|nr:glycosyltransferase family 2 protein [Alphaproteobacteria bacterium]
MIRPTISVVISNYNHGHFLAEALAGVLDSPSPPDEVILVDDASEDQSLDLAKDFARRYPFLRVIANATNHGALEATNIGMRAATGTYVGLFNADNPVSPALVPAVRRVLATHPGIGVVGCGAVIRRVDTGSERIYGFDIPGLTFDSDHVAVLAPQAVAEVYRRGYLWIATAGALLRRDLICELGGMRADLDWLSDWFAVHTLALRYGAALVDRPFVLIREDTDSYGRRAQADPSRINRTLDHLLDTLATRDFTDIRAVARRAPILMLTPLRWPLLARLAHRPCDWDLAVPALVQWLRWQLGGLVRPPPRT